MDLISRDYEVEFAKQHPHLDVPEPEPVERQGCPRCKTTHIRWYKSWSEWHCVKCGRVFSQPVVVLALSPQQKAALSTTKREVARRWYAGFWAAMGELVRRDAVLQSIEQHQRYLTCEDTTTFCKRCAFFWDMKKQKLCPICRERYISFVMQACYECQ